MALPCVYRCSDLVGAALEGGSWAWPGLHPGEQCVTIPERITNPSLVLVSMALSPATLPGTEATGPGPPPAGTQTTASGVHAPPSFPIAWLRGMQTMPSAPLISRSVCGTHSSAY